MPCISGGNSISTSAKNPVSASSAVCRMVLRNVSDQMLCNVAEHASEMVRNVAEQVRNVSGQVCSEMIRNVSDLLRNVADHVYRMLCNVA